MFSAQNLVKRRDGNLIVADVSLYLQRGETVALLGSNGAGKTTVFRLLVGVLPPDSGSVFIGGIDVTFRHVFDRARLGLSYLSQEPSLFRGLTVEQNILLVLEAREPDRYRQRRRLEELLAIFELQSIRRVHAGRLSGGERRRCEIARAFATRPSFILLDEPFAGVDPLAVGNIQKLIKNLTEAGVGILITDHNVRDTLRIADRVYLIESGRILVEGPVEQIVADPEVRRIYLTRGFEV